MKISDYFRFLAVLLISQVFLTVFLTVLMNKRPTSLEMSNFKCSCFQNNEDREIIFSPEAPIYFSKDDSKNLDRKDQNINFTTIAQMKATSVFSTNGWLESLRRLHIPCKVKLVLEVIEPHLKVNLENVIHGIGMDVELIPVKSELEGPNSLHSWNQLFKIFLDELLQDHDILYVDVQSVWLNNPMPMIWSSYESFDMWVAQDADRVNIDTRFIFMKSGLLNLRFTNGWKMLLNGGSFRSSESSKICFQKSVEKFKITHNFQVKEFDFVKFPVRKDYTTQWIRLNKNNVYVIHGVNSENLISVQSDSVPHDAMESNITDENARLPTSLKRENVTVLAVTNSAFVDFTKNWLQSLLLLNKTFRVKLLTEDEESATALRKVALHLRNSNVNFSVESERNSSGKALGFYTKAYLDLVNARPQSILREMIEGHDVLLVDIDAVWLKDPLPLIWSRYSMFDVFVATGYDDKTPCPCFLYLKNSMMNVRMVSDWFKRLKRVNASPIKAKHENDMDALAKILYKYSSKYNMQVHKLNSIQFPTGDLYFKTPSFYDNHRKEVYVVHGNRLGKHDNKLFFFKLLHLWYADNWDFRNSPVLL